MKHTLIVIGATGSKRAYLDIPMEQAVARFLAWLGSPDDGYLDDIKIIEFTDEFSVYDASAD